MRILMWFTIGFAGACAAGAYFSLGVWVGIVAIAIAGGLFFIKPRIARITAVVMLGVSVGMLWFWGHDSLYLQAAKQYDGEIMKTEVTVCSNSWDTDFGIAAEAEIQLGGKKFQTRVYLNRTEPLSPGDIIADEFRIRLTTGNSSVDTTYHQSEGIFLLLNTTENAVVTKGEELPLSCYPAILRNRITTLIDSTFPEDTVAFARALLLGDSTLLTYREDTSFKLSGIRHVIAVSGLHISILFSLLCIFTGRRRILLTLLGIPVLILFAGVAGFTPSVVRACIMQSLMILAMLFNKEYDPPTALAFAVLVMLGINPLAITSVSLQLSAGCVVGILLFYPKINGFLVKKLGVEKGRTWKPRLLRWLCGSVSITFSTMISTTPLSAMYFGTISLAGVFTNLLTLWVISFIFYGIVLSCALGVIYLPLAKAVGWVISWPIRYVLFVADLLSGSVFSAVYTCSVYVVIWLCLCYVLLTAFLFSKNKRPGLLMLSMLTGLAVAISLSWLEPKLDNYRVTVLDVGQGQSVLLQFDDKAFLVDCGGDSGQRTADAVIHQLLSQGITKLDGVILTHYDKDHVNGVEALLSWIDAETLYLPDTEPEDVNRLSFEMTFGDRIYWIREDTELSAEKGKIILFSGEQNENTNENCTSVLFQSTNCDILITGDLGTSGEQKLLEKTSLPKLDLLVVGHHGSAGSTGLPLLEMTQPENAIISVGDNSSSLPSWEALYRLNMFGSRIWRTDLNGTILFRG